MSLFNTKLLDIVRSDRRYAYEAYEFIFQALEHTQKMLGRSIDRSTIDPSEPQHHVTCRQLLEGARELAIREFGLMARVVFKQWGISSTDDFGEIVFNMVEFRLLATTENDSREDFKNGYNFDEAFRKPFLPESKKAGEQIVS